MGMGVGGGKGREESEPVPQRQKQGGFCAGLCPVLWRRRSQQSPAVARRPRSSGSTPTDQRRVGA